MRLVLLLCVLSLASACGKKTSREFYKLESEQSVLVSRDGDDAYVSEEMAAVIVSLQAIPENTVEKPRAQDLAAKLQAERARVTAERAALEKPQQPPTADPFAGRVFGEPLPAEPVAAAEPVDAGVVEPEPYAGMDEATFAKLFGTCFKKGPNTVVGKGLPATSQVLLPTEPCQKRLGNPGGTTSYLFVDGGVWGTVIETVTVADAGPPPQPVAPAPAAGPTDAGEAILRIPGAPLPEGYQKSTVY